MQPSPPTRPRVLCLGPAPKAPSPEVELSPTSDLAALLERLREESVDLVVLADPALPLSTAVDLIVETDPGVVLLIVRDVIPSPEREGLLARASVFTCPSSDLSPGLLRAASERAARLRAIERRANATEAALKSARRWREETEAKLRDLFHELRTPVAVALGWCSNLADGIEGPIDARQKDVLSRARAALETMGQLLESGPALPAMAEAVGALLELERARERRRRRVRLDELATELLAMMQVEADRKKVKLQLVAEQELPSIWGERARLSQVILNLVGNALRHARSNVIVRVQRALGSDQERALLLVVEDDGLGFEASVLAHSFERGVSGDRRSGLGLSIVKEICREHGGRCSAANRDGGGAELQVQLPIDPRTRARSPIEVLVLDDELLLGPLVHGLIESEGVELIHLLETGKLLESLRVSGGRLIVSEAVAGRIRAAPRPSLPGPGGGG